MQIFIRTSVNVLLNCHNIFTHTNVRHGNNLQYHLWKHLCCATMSTMSIYKNVRNCNA